MVITALTQNVRFNAVLFVIDITNEVQSIHGGVKIKKNENADIRPLSLKSGIDLARE